MTNSTITESVKTLHAPIYGAMKKVQIQFFISIALFPMSFPMMPWVRNASTLSEAKMQAGFFLLGFGVYLLNDINRAIQILKHREAPALAEGVSAEIAALRAACSLPHLMINMQLGTAIFFIFCPDDYFDRLFLRQGTQEACALCLGSIPIIFAILTWCALKVVSLRLDRASKDTVLI